MNIIRFRSHVKLLHPLVRSTSAVIASSSFSRCFSKQVPETQSQQPSRTAESVGFMVGEIFGNVKKSVAKYMARSLASKNLYEAAADKINYADFFIACSMPDTFQSWFYVMQLHLWLILVRLRSEDSTGKTLSYNMVEIMWQDLDARIRLLDVNDTSQRKDTMQELAQQFFGLVIAYDEGLLGHDRVLASALWRNLFYNKADTDAEKLALMVEYVRKQIQHLEKQSSEDILMYGKIDWLPLYEEKAPE